MRLARFLRLPLALLAAGGFTAGAAAQPAGPAALAWSDCALKGVVLTARCTSLTRPLDPARPGGPMIQVQVAVLPALARRPLPDALYFFAGGPGQSAIELAGPIRQMLGQALTRRDLVLIDQRGTGRSAPLACDEPPPQSPLAELFDPARQLQRWRACRQRLAALPQGDLRFYTTALAIADVEAVRQALGHARINLVGVSYGTRAALEYLRQVPQAVRRVVLDGVAPPDMRLPSSSTPDQARALDAMLGACESEPACLRRHADLRRHLQQLRSGPDREVTVLHPWTGREDRFRLTQGVLAQLLRAPLYLPVLASALPLALDEAAAGRFSPLVGLAAATQGSAGGLYSGAHFAVVCAEDMAAPAAEAPGRDAPDPVWESYRQACADLPRAEVPRAFYTVPPAAVPVLLLSGDHDPVTPPRHALRVAQALGAQARALTVRHAGHGTLAVPCVRALAERFLTAADADEALADAEACVGTRPWPPAYPGTAP